MLTLFWQRNGSGLAKYWSTYKNMPLEPLSVPEEPISIESFSKLSVREQQAEKALDDYFNLLEAYPHLRRTGSLNDHTKGAIEIIYDREKIKEVENLFYDKFIEKLRNSGLSDFQISEEAFDSSRVGRIAKDGYLIWLRDAVVQPNGQYGQYYRIIKKASLNQHPGAAVLVIKQDGEMKKVYMMDGFLYSALKMAEVKGLV